MTAANRKRVSSMLVLVAIGAAAFAIDEQSKGSYEGSTWDVTIAWLVGLGCLGGLAFLGRDPEDRASEPEAEAEPWLTPFNVAGGWILAVAAAARLVALSRFPTAIDPDEGTFLLQARRARLGTLPNPWGTGVLTSPDGYYAWEGRFSALFGNGIGAYRTLSAVLGIVTVFAVWRLGRRLFGEVTGLVAMGIIAVLPLHLWASRSALNNVTHAVVAVVLLWLLDRAVSDRRRVDSLAAGVVAGLGAYGYFGGTIFVAVALAVLLAVMVLPAFDLGVRAAASIAGWLLLGTLVVAAPLIGHFVDLPDRLVGRYQQVDGISVTITDRLAAVAGGVVFPVVDRNGAVASGGADFYRVDGPFLGLVVGPLAVAGIGVWAWWTFRRIRSARQGPPDPSYRCEPLLAAWLLLTVAVSQTEKMASQRWLALTPIWALSAAVALVALGRLLVSRTALRPATLTVAGAMLIGAVSLATADRFYDEDQQRRAYGDNRTTGAYDLGWRMAAGDPALRIISLGRPYQPYSQFGNLRFLWPETDLRVLEVEPLAVDGAPGEPAPVLGPDEIAVVAAERIATDWCPMYRSNPEAQFAEVRDRYGVVLYLLVAPGGLRVPTGPSPAESTLTAVNGRRPGPAESTWC